MKHVLKIVMGGVFLLVVSCSTESEDEKVIIEPELLSLEFSSSNNPYQLIGDAKCEFSSDSTLECWVPYLMDNKVLIPNVRYNGDYVELDGVRIQSGVFAHDFSRPVLLTVSSSGVKKTYTVYVHTFTGLPVLWIETVDRKAITSKEEYLEGNVRLVEDVITRSSGDVVEAGVQIKGRGNTSWNMAKKSYRLKFGEKVSLLDEPKDKSWVLLANYADKTKLRNATAFYMSEISNLEYTPKMHFVDVMLNGTYNGNYQLGDKLKISKNRVNVGDDGFLLEVDAKAASDEITFKVKNLLRQVNIKEPDVAVGDGNYKYIKEYVMKADSVLYSDGFLDEANGYKKYLDVESFVDWYLINEISKNCDSRMHTSCFMNMKRGGKLKMGPVWDFDIGFGNVNYTDAKYPEGFWLKSADWFERMFEDPYFVQKVKERYNYFYGRKADIMRNIDDNAQYIRYSVIEDNGKWGTLYKQNWPNYDVWGSYQNEVQFLKTWLNARMEWLKAEFDNM